MGYFIVVRDLTTNELEFVEAELAAHVRDIFRRFRGRADRPKRWHTKQSDRYILDNYGGGLSTAQIGDHLSVVLNRPITKNMVIKRWHTLQDMRRFLTGAKP